MRILCVNLSWTCLPLWPSLSNEEEFFFTNVSCGPVVGTCKVNSFKLSIWASSFHKTGSCKFGLVNLVLLCLCPIRVYQVFFLPCTIIIILIILLEFFLTVFQFSQAYDAWQVACILLALLEFIYDFFSSSICYSAWLIPNCFPIFPSILADRWHVFYCTT